MNLKRVKHWVTKLPYGWLTDSNPALLSWIFLRGLALIYVAAFASMAVQIEGLIGAEGILPAKSWLLAQSQRYTEDRYWLFPTVFWLDASDVALKSACFAGMGAAVLLFLNLFDRLALAACYVLYLSITVAGQEFTSFQWDVFLLEAGFMGIFMTWGSGLMVWLYRFLIARFMFMGGVVKLASGDPSWADLSALGYHYLTQPLPSPLAYHAYYLPQWFHKLCVGGVFLIELIVPFFVFMPRPFRLVAAWSFIVLQSVILLTGNYNFFNLLTVLLCLLLFDDQDVSRRLPVRLVAFIQSRRPNPGHLAHVLAAVWIGAVLTVCAASAWKYHAKAAPVTPFNELIWLTSAFAVVNNYGPFSVMTTERNEIIVEGSHDGKKWRAYEFKFKPGSLDRRLGWNIPHQPRLDWQMWFAALERPAKMSWFGSFMARLTEGSSGVLSLLRYNPFSEGPPRYVRARLYRYHFTTPEEREATGRIWRRSLIGMYWPPD
ncbi:MAG: lipase maturation factor family protein [Gammaproteobacteria bacterium]